MLEEIVNKDLSPVFEATSNLASNCSTDSASSSPCSFLQGEPNMSSMYWYAKLVSPSTSANSLLISSMTCLVHYRMVDECKNLKNDFSALSSWHHQQILHQQNHHLLLRENRYSKKISTSFFLVKHRWTRKNCGIISHVWNHAVSPVCCGVR